MVLTSLSLLLPPASSNLHGSQDFTALLHPEQVARLPNHRYQRCGVVSAIGFSPVHFPGGNSRRLSCYAFDRGWLLLSLPDRCLRIPTRFGLTLSRYLGALTTRWLVRLSATELSPARPSPGYLRPSLLSL